MQAAKALGPGAADEIVAYHRPSNIEMPRRLLRCLRGLDWLNDEVIIIYMGMLQACSPPFLLNTCAILFNCQSTQAVAETPAQAGRYSQKSALPIPACCKLILECHASLNCPVHELSMDCSLSTCSCVPLNSSNETQGGCF